MTGKQTAKQDTRRPGSAAARRLPGRTRRGGIIVTGVVLAVAAATVALWLVLPHPPTRSGGHTGSSAYPYQVGSPGAGALAPAFSLPATTGRQVSLADYRGRSVLVFFQEGLMCQPCWDQIVDIERNAAAWRASGVDAVVSITSDPPDLLARKARDMSLTTPVLSDPDLTVIRAYQANKYGMMGDARAGHSFVLIGPDGVIRWRADYGGPPKYVMFVPTSQLLADLRRDQADRR